MKKKYTLIIFLLIANFVQAQSKIVATTTIVADIVQNIAGEVFEVEHIVPVGGDPHRYEPVPQDAQRIAKAELIFINGLTLEGWINKFIGNAGTKATVVTLTNGIKPIKSQKYDAPDPHAWMTAENGIVYARNALNALVTYAPQHRSVFEANFERYRKQLEQLEIAIFQEIDKIPKEQRILVTSHDAFQYFGRHYGLRLESILGTSTDADVQTADIMRVQKLIKTTDLPALFVESTINPKLLEQIATDNDVKIGGELYADALGDLGGAADTYLKMLQHNAETISYGLKTGANPVESSADDEEPQARSLASEAKTEPAATSNKNYWLLIGGLGVAVLGFLFFRFRKK